MSPQVIEGGARFFKVPGSIVRHTRAECPSIIRSRRVVEVREIDLWVGFLCEYCRAAAPTGEEQP